MTEATFESWGIVEIMGHKIYAGKLSEQVIAGAAMLRVDVPEVDGIAGYTKFFGSSAIYAITPTDEANAQSAATRLRERPVSTYVLPVLAATIPEPEIGIDYPEDEDDDDLPDHDDEDEDEDEAQKASEWACALFANFPVFRVLDLETTGVEFGSEPVSIGVIDSNGKVLLETLVKPSGPIPEDASAVHGITDDQVADAPTFAEVWPVLIAALGGMDEKNGAPLRNEPVVIYNSSFDTRVLRETAIKINQTLPPFNWQCAMEAYAKYWGEWNSRRGSYVWQRLQNAIKQQDIKVEGTAHSAIGDCRSTLMLVRKMAGRLPVIPLRSAPQQDSTSQE